MLAVWVERKVKQASSQFFVHIKLPICYSIFWARTQSGQTGYSVQHCPAQTVIKAECFKVWKCTLCHLQFLVWGLELKPSRIKILLGEREQKFASAGGSHERPTSTAPCLSAALPEETLREEFTAIARPSNPRSYSLTGWHRAVLCNALASFLYTWWFL